MLLYFGCHIDRSLKLPNNMFHPSRQRKINTKIQATLRKQTLYFNFAENPLRPSLYSYFVLGLSDEMQIVKMCDICISLFHLQQR